MTGLRVRPDIRPVGEPTLVRRATLADLDDILGVQREAERTATPRFRELTAEAILVPSAHVVVATASAEVVGWAMTHYFAEPDDAAPAGHYLMGVTVVPALRRRGIGTRLIEARLGWIRTRADRAYYFTNVRNTASREAHRRWGFRELARAPAFRNVPFDGGEGILLAADLPGPGRGDQPGR